MYRLYLPDDVAWAVADMNADTSTTSTTKSFNAAEREAALTLLRYELRQGKTVEGAAKEYNLPLRLAQKATQPRRRRQRTVAPQLREVDCRLERIEHTLRLLEERMLTLDATLYELIDLAAKPLPEPATLNPIDVGQP